MGVRHTWRVWSPARKAGVVIDATSGSHVKAKAFPGLVTEVIRHW